MSEQKVVQPLAEWLRALLQRAWTNWGAENVTYQMLYTQVVYQLGSDAEGIPITAQSEFQIGRALDYAHTREWIAYEGEIRWCDEYRVSSSLVLQPGARSGLVIRRPEELAS